MSVYVALPIQYEANLYRLWISLHNPFDVAPSFNDTETFSKCFLIVLSTPLGLCAYPLRKASIFFLACRSEMVSVVSANKRRGGCVVSVMRNETVDAT